MLENQEEICIPGSVTTAQQATRVQLGCIDRTVSLRTLLAKGKEEAKLSCMAKLSERSAPEA